MILVAGKNEMFINLIGDYRHKVALGDTYDLENVLFAEDASTRIRWICDDNRCSILVNQRLQMIQIDLPIALRYQVVRAAIDAEALRQGSIDRKSRFWDQNVLSRSSNGSYTKIQSAAASRTQNDVVCLHVSLMLRIFRYGLSRLNEADRRSVTVVVAFVDCVFYCVDNLIGWR